MASCNILAVFTSYIMQEPLEQNDKYLILKAFQGDAECFGLLFDKYSSRIYRFIYYKIVNKELAEDMVSQCFLKAWEQISGGQKVSAFQAWIYRIARNLVIDYYRTREKEELPLIYQEDIEAQQSAEIYDPEAALDRETLEKLLLGLKSEVREIVVLKYIEDLSISEIAKIVDKSVGNVRVILHRAIKDLQSKLKI